MMNLAAARIGIRLLQKPVSLVTPNGAFQNGRWQEDPTEVTILAVVQAANQTDLVAQGIADKLDGHVRIWTEAPLRTVNEDAPDDAQRIVTPEGATYRIVKVAARTEAGFTRAIGRVFNDRGRSV